MNETIYQQIEAAQKEMDLAREKVIALRKQLEPEPVNDYTLTDTEGQPVLLSSLFGKGDELLVIHNMGKKCSYCTLWADGLNSVSAHINDRVPMVLISPDEPAVQKEFAEGRGWSLRTLSAQGSSFIADMGFEPQPKNYWPGVSAFIKKDGKMFRVAKDTFGPGDLYSNVWHLFDLLPKGSNEWSPKYKY